MLKLNKIAKSYYHCYGRDIVNWETGKRKWDLLLNASMPLFDGQFMQKNKALILATEFTNVTRDVGCDNGLDITEMMEKYNIKKSTLFNRIDEELLLRQKGVCTVESPHVGWVEHPVSTKTYPNKNCRDFDITFKTHRTYYSYIPIFCLDDHYGPGSAYSILLKLLDNRFEWHGIHSIHYPYTYSRICNTASKINQDNNLAKIFLDNTRHTRMDWSIDLTLLCNLFQITPAELLYYLIRNSGPFGMGVFDHKKETLTIERCQEILDKRCYHVDYYNGIAVKNSFRENPIERQSFDIRRFEDRGGNFYHSIFSLLNDKLSHSTDDELL